MHKHLRLNEYKVLIYRLSLAYVFYFIARIFFLCIYNIDLLRVDSVSDLLSLCYYGLAFDTTAILYVNLLFILLFDYYHFLKIRLQVIKSFFSICILEQTYWRMQQISSILFITNTLLRVPQLLL